MLLIWQAGLRSELDIATDEMEKAQQRLAALEREKEVLQGTTSPTASQAFSEAAPNKLVEESLRSELKNQVSFKSSSCCDSCTNRALVSFATCKPILQPVSRHIVVGLEPIHLMAAKCHVAVSKLASMACHLHM